MLYCGSTSDVISGDEPHAAALAMGQFGEEIAGDIPVEIVLLLYQVLTLRSAPLTALKTM